MEAISSSIVSPSVTFHEVKFVFSVLVTVCVGVPEHKTNWEDCCLFVSFHWCLLLLCTFLCSTPLFWIILCLRQVVSIYRPLFPLTISANCCSSRWFCLQFLTGCSYNILFLMYIPCRLHILSSTGFMLCCCIFRYIFIFHIYECICRLHTWWKVCFLPLSQSVIASRSQNLPLGFKTDDYVPFSILWSRFQLLTKSCYSM